MSFTGPSKYMRSFGQIVNTGQCSPFKTLCLGSIGMDHVISESCYKGTNFIKEL